MNTENLLLIGIGDFYEDCAYHPCLCTYSNGDDIEGISLVDGSIPRSCSLKHCGIKKLTTEEAIRWRLKGPENVDHSISIKWI
jgi:hypothetical protein